WPLSLSEEAMLTRLYPIHFGQQLCTAEAHFEQIRMLPVGTYCRIRERAIRHERTQTETFASYEDAIQAGAAGIENQVGIACANRRAVYRLSGGWDSRIVYGALLKRAL